MKPIVNLLTAFALFGMASASHAARNYCGELKNHYGPFDYRSNGNWSLVEDAHFNEQVQNGLGGVTGPIGGDLDYTLRAIPNHPRALAVIGEVSIRTKKPQLENAKYPTECYFERAVRFAPDDAVVRAAYGNYLAATGKADRALMMFRTAVNLAPDNPAINYNLGLLYMKNKDYEHAATYAEKAYSLGFPLPGLRNQLAQVGRPLSASKPAVAPAPAADQNN